MSPHLVNGWILAWAGLTVAAFIALACLGLIQVLAWRRRRAAGSDLVPIRRLRR